MPYREFIGLLPPDETDRQSKANGRRHGDGRSLLTEPFAQNRIANRGKEGKG
ncbi:hypothetical protein ACFL5Z_20850 [Planctomycetota bacterium]